MKLIRRGSVTVLLFLALVCMSQVSFAVLKLPARKKTASTVACSPKKSAACKTKKKKQHKHIRSARKYSAPVRVSTRAVSVSIKDVTEALANPPEPAIEQPEALAPFFQKLAELEADPSKSVHILHFGDSHTAADMFTGEVRRAIQERFGGGGAGFSFAGYPFAGYRIYGTKREQTHGWAVIGTRFRDLTDPMLGLGGIAIEASQPGERISLDAECDYAELEYMQQPLGGQLSIWVDGVFAQSVSTAGPVQAGYATMALSPGLHHLEATTTDAAPVRLLGWVTQKSSGVTYEALGINGAEASLPLRWNADMQISYLQRREPALIVLAYGTNEASNSSWTYDSYREMLRTLIGRLRKAAPQASILIIGPGDRYIHGNKRSWTPFAGIDRIVSAQRDTCRELGCAYWDQREHMGGAGSMRDWVNAQWAQPDHTHFTGTGYVLLGKSFYKDLMREYEEFKGQQSTATASK